MTEDERTGIWKTESLRIYLQRLLDEHKSHVMDLINEQARLSEAQRLSLKEIFDREIEGLRELFKQSREDDRQGVSKAEASIEKRLDSVNEFRAQLGDQAARLMPRMEADARFGAQDKEITTLTQRMDRGTGKSEGMSASLAMLFMIVGTLIGLAGLLFGMMRK